jgi:hypothetical protein
MRCQGATFFQWSLIYFVRNLDWGSKKFSQPAKDEERDQRSRQRARNHSWSLSNYFAIARAGGLRIP